MTAPQVFMFVAFACLVAAALCAVFGWLTNTPDGPRRYARRLAAWVFFGGNIGFNFCAFHDHWWSWVLALGTGLLVIDRVGHWWRQLEAARQLRRALGRHYYGTVR